MIGFFVSMIYTAVCGSMGAVVGRSLADLFTTIMPPF